jgi:hypothetical protein
MPGPLADVKYIHNAFRFELQRLQSDIKFFATLGDGDADALAKRFSMVHEVLGYHEKAEEAVLFPAVDAIEKGHADAYEKTHREIDPLRNELLAALKAGNVDKAFDLIMQLKPKMDAHLNQEEQELMPWCEQRMQPEQQGQLVGAMGQKMPQEKMFEIVPWMVRALPVDDRVGVLQMWHKVLPPPVFASVKGMAKSGVNDQQWNELVGRMPELA